MRFYIKDSERKPDPEPAQVNAKLAIKVGLVLWVLALVFLVFQATQSTTQKPWWPFTCVFGILLGVYALIHEHRRR